MSSNASKEERKGPDNELLSEEERTPKRLKHMDPDLTVVVGGVEFHHYSVILCNSCPFFENMLSSTMRESEQMRIDFPDKDPKEWLEVYKCLDQHNGDPQQPLLTAPVTPENALRLASWFEYLGLGNLVHVCDRVLEKKYYDLFQCEGDFVSYPNWCSVKLFSLPRTQKLMLARTRNSFMLYAFDFCDMDEKDRQEVIQQIKSFLLDEQCGMELWMHFATVLDFPDHMRRNMNRNDIIASPFFQYLFEMGGQKLEIPEDHEKVFFEENKPLEEEA